MDAFTKCVIMHMYLIPQAAFKHVKDNGIHVKVTCEYLQHYLKKHPELGDLVIK